MRQKEGMRQARQRSFDVRGGFWEYHFGVWLFVIAEGVRGRLGRGLHFTASSAITLGHVVFLWRSGPGVGFLLTAYLMIGPGRHCATYICRSLGVVLPISTTSSVGVSLSWFGGEKRGELERQPRSQAKGLSGNSKSQQSLQIYYPNGNGALRPWPSMTPSLSLPGR